MIFVEDGIALILIAFKKKPADILCFNFKYFTDNMQNNVENYQLSTLRKNIYIWEKMYTLIEIKNNKPKIFIIL